MPTQYQPGIPTGTVNLDQDYINIRNNFTQLNDTYKIDHVAYDVTENNGYHKNVHLVPVGSDPVATADIGQIYDKTINDGFSTDQSLFFETGSGKVLQLTSNLVPLNAEIGYTFLPGGVIFQWGDVSTVFNSQSVNITFPKAFSSNIWNVSVTLSGGTVGSDRRTITVTTTSTTGFTAFLVGGVNGIYDGLYWTAIGK